MEGSNKNGSPEDNKSLTIDTAGFDIDNLDKVFNMEEEEDDEEEEEEQEAKGPLVSPEQMKSIMNGLPEDIIEGNPNGCCKLILLKMGRFEISYYK